MLLFNSSKLLGLSNDLVMCGSKIFKYLSFETFSIETCKSLETKFFKSKSKL